jgi:hypothetical protein
MTEVTVTFRLNEGYTKESLIDTLKVLTFEEGVSYLEEIVSEIETDNEILLNA